jgi:hypothetical protein
MEDLKKYLGVLAKHSFWIVTAIVLILSTVFFYLTKTSLDESITSRISALNASYNKINDVKGKVTTHPNDYSHKEMDQRLTRLKEDVDRAWEFQYDRQKELLTWPTEAFFEPRTHEIFDSLRPFEKKVPFPIPDKPPAPLDSITENDRNVYRNYIAPEFPSLARRIGSTWKYTLDPKTMAPTQGGFGPPPGAGGFGPPGYGAATTTQDSRDLVRWSEDSQKALASAVLPWFSRPSPPTIHEIYYAQEDIWILRGLMDIIATTNAGAQENFQAIVKEIEWIRTGSKTSRDVGNLWQAGSQGQSGGSPYGGGGPPAGYSGGGSGGMPAGYGGAGGPMGKGGDAMAAARTVVKVDPADGRYVDTNFKPLTGAQLRSAMNLVNATDAVNAVAKRVPVRMRLKVDDRFGRLITECGNGKMMLEVLQVRYNTEDASGPGGSGGGSASRPAFGSGGGTGGLMNTGESPAPGAGGQASVEPSGEVSIEIYGLIYLYNPPANLSGTNAAVTVPAPTAAPAPPPPTTAAAPAASTPAGNTPAVEAPVAAAPAAAPPVPAPSDVATPATAETPPSVPESGAPPPSVPTENPPAPGAGG